MNNFKNLGVEMCSNTKWYEQINSITQKTRKTIYIMREFRDTLNKKDSRSIYSTLIKPLISCGTMGWGRGGSYDNALSRLQTSQNILIKIVLNKDETYRTKVLYEDINVLNINNLY